MRALLATLLLILGGAAARAEPSSQPQHILNDYWDVSDKDRFAAFVTALGD